MKKRILSILLSVGLSMSLVGCSTSSEKNVSVKNDTKVENKTNDKKGVYPINFKNYDAKGKVYTEKIEKKPTKIITTNQTATELLLELGLGKDMIGTSYLDNPILPKYKAEYDKIPVLSKKYPSKEIVLAKKPDIIVGWSSAFFDKSLGNVDFWNGKGINTFIQRNTVEKERTVNNVYKDIDDLGTIFNIKNKTDKIVSSMKSRINDIHSKVKNKKPMKVLIIEGSDNNKYYAYGQNSLASDMVKLAGGENVETNKEGGEYSAENILAKNPDAIVLIHFETQVKDNKEAKTLLENKALQNVNAIKNKKIIYTPLSEVYAGGVRTINGVERLAKGFYPDLFK